MGIVVWLVMGLVVGTLAKWIMPGKDPGGLLVTIGVGIAGAMVGGWLSTLLGLGGVEGFDLSSLVTATAGALLLLWGYRRLRG